MTMHFRDIAAQAAADGVVSAEEILALRQLGWADGKMEPEEAESLFLANDHLTQPSQEWCDFFVEALTEFVVNTVEPKGYIDDIMAEELVSRIDHDGKVESLAELELLVRVIEKALSSPPSLKDYALRQIEAIVLGGEGVTRRGELDPKGINDTECDLLRRVLHAAGGDRAIGISRAEADLLFRIKDATLYEVNSKRWEDLFVKGVANYLLGFGGPEPLSRERAAELESFMNSTGSGIGGFLGRMMKNDVDENASSAFGSLLDMSQPESDLDAEVEQAARLTETEELWLLDHIDADEEIDELEKALLAFIAVETGQEVIAS